MTEDPRPLGGTTSPEPPEVQPGDYALPLVIHVEKAAPPRRTDALEAAARAVLVFLTDPRVTEPGGEWHGQVRAWTDGRIRKVVRRARGANWRRAAELPGITLTHGTAEVRVYPPVPVDDWPPGLSRLQVSGTDLEDPESPPDPPNGSPVLYLNPHLSMSAGKAMAQAGHAAQIAWYEAGTKVRSEWRGSGFDLAVRTASAERWAELLARGDAPPEAPDARPAAENAVVPGARPASPLIAVRDAGFTEVEPGSLTVVADLPSPSPR